MTLLSTVYTYIFNLTSGQFLPSSFPGDQHRRTLFGRLVLEVGRVAQLPSLDTGSSMRDGFEGHDGVNILEVGRVVKTELLKSW